jgi:hypothetical protein
VVPSGPMPNPRCGVRIQRNSWSPVGEEGSRGLWRGSGVRRLERGEELAHRNCRRLDLELAAGRMRERRGIGTREVVLVGSG